jgi:hypothetical protein
LRICASRKNGGNVIPRDQGGPLSQGKHGIAPVIRERLAGIHKNQSTMLLRLEHFGIEKELVV